MKRNHWLFFVTALVVLGLGAHGVMDARASHRSGARIISETALALEASSGKHVYAPSWLPYEGRVGPIGCAQGSRRTLQDFTDNQDRDLAILAQEGHSPARDRYNTRIFVTHADNKMPLTGTVTGYFVTGDRGERRLYWSEKDAVLILSSPFLRDEELANIARKVR